MRKRINANHTDINEVLDQIHLRYGYDFKNYSRSSLSRRLTNTALRFKIPTLDQLTDKLVNDDSFFTLFLQELTVNTTSMFRDPAFYLSLRKNILPQLDIYPTIRIWHAGCSSGEEVFSTAILLDELGLLNRSLLYGTDINQQMLDQAQHARIPLSCMPEFKINYKLAGGTADLSQYCTEKDEYAHFSKTLTQQMIFSTHNLVTDHSFNEFQLILCRNVLIYFDRALQNRVLGIFNASLPKLGYLALGGKESIKLTDYTGNFKSIDKNQRIWLKVK